MVRRCGVGSVGPISRPGAVVHERQVTDQRDRARPADVAARGQRRTDGRRHRAVDAGDPAVGPHRDAAGVQPDQRDVAHRVGRAEHQLVAGPQRVGDRGGDVQAGGQRVRVELAAHRVDRVPVDLGAAPQPGRVRARRWSTARVPVACELPDTSGQRGPVVSANTGTDGSASSADTGRCSVGRPSMITCCGRSSGSASGCSGLAGSRRGRLGDRRQRRRGWGAHRRRGRR